VSESEIARRFDSPMLSRIAAQKAAETASQADLASVARLKASRTAGPSPAARSAGAGKSGLARNVQQRPNRVWYTQAHDLAERAVGFVSNNHGDRGGVRGLKHKRSLGLRAFRNS
jgi:hypothetical protein